MRTTLFKLASPLVLLGADVGALQVPLIPWERFSGSQAPLAEKELVSSSAFQEKVHAENLFERAKDLYKIAELGESEYGHPTRVIGSKGIVTGDVRSRNRDNCPY